MFRLKDFASRGNPDDLHSELCSATRITVPLTFAAAADRLGL
jgi:hypothetical protein